MSIIAIDHQILKMVVESNNISSEALQTTVIPTTNKINLVHAFNHQLKIIQNSHIQIMCQCRKILFHLTMENKIPTSDKGRFIEENGKWQK